MLRIAPSSASNAQPRASWTSFAVTLQLASFLIWVALIVRPDNLPDPFGLGPSWSLTVLCLAAAAVILLPDLLAGRVPSTSIDRILALYLVFVAIACTRGNNPHNMAATVASLLGNLAIFYATVVLARKTPRFGEGIQLLLILSIALVQLLALAYHAELGLLARPAEYPVPEGWSGYPELATLAVMQFGVLVAALQVVRTAPMFLVVASLIVINFIQLVLLYSRGALLAAGLIVFAAGCTLALRRQIGRMLGITGIVLTVVLVLFLTNPTLRYLSLTMIGDSKAPAWAGEPVFGVATNQMRTELWRRTLRMISDRPIRGVGPGNFQEVFETQYNPELNNDTRRGVHAHNLWLQQFAEIGVLGGAIYVVLWGKIFALFWRFAREQATFLSLGLLFSIVGIIGSNITTNMFYLTGGASGRLQSLTWMLIGLASASAIPVAPHLESRKARGGDQPQMTIEPRLAR